MRPHRQQPIRLPRPWDSFSRQEHRQVGCHFLLQCIKVKSESEVAQLCLTLSDSMDYSPPGSSLHGIFQQEYRNGGAVAFYSTALMYSFSYLEPVCCSMSSSNCCLLACTQISQEADQVFWYSHLLKNFPQFIVIHTVKAFA